MKQGANFGLSTETELVLKRTSNALEHASLVMVVLLRGGLLLCSMIRCVLTVRLCFSAA